jgi:predicted hydrocarbon binding protein
VYMEIPEFIFFNLILFVIPRRSAVGSFIVGKKMNRFFISGSIEELLSGLPGFWQLHCFGEIDIDKLDPLTLIIHDCFDCSDMPDVGRTLCALDEGILKTCIRLTERTKRTAARYIPSVQPSAQ